jgi:alpha-N-arabinofuranosidase
VSSALDHLDFSPGESPALSRCFKAWAKIDRNIFGQFAEHLGQGVYEGIWVGPDSKIPNTRGIRNDVVSALKAIKVPNIRWPEAALQMNTTGAKLSALNVRVTLNPNWGGSSSQTRSERMSS